MSTPVVPLGAGPQSADEFQIYTQTQNIKFLTRAVQPPSQLFVDVSDDIVCSMASSVAGERVTVSYRLLRFDGEVVLGQFQVSAVGLRTVVTHTEDLAEGFLLSVSCKATLATTRGQTFVRIFLTDPALGSGQPTYMIMADYVTNQFAPAYPGGRVISPVEGPGLLFPLQIAAPGAGADWQAVVPINARWAVRSFAATLTTAVAVANRYVTFTGVTVGGPVFRCGADKVQAASQVTLYGGAAMTPNVSPDAGFGMVGIPPAIVLTGNNTFNSITRAIQAADTWASIALFIEEWLDNV